MSANTQRMMLVQLEVVQLSLATLIICAIGAFIVVFGVAQYWIFVSRHWNSMNRAPQSKLDWMLRTLNTEGNTHHHSAAIRQKLRDAMANAHRDGAGVPLTATASRSQNRETLRTRSVASSIYNYPPTEVVDKGVEDPARSRSSQTIHLAYLTPNRLQYLPFPRTNQPGVVLMD